MSLYYDRAGQPITFTQWVELLVPENQRVAKSEVGEAVVSTVWLGLDHNFGGDGPPLIFETMILGGTLDQQQWRYSTEAEARAGHEHAVKLARAEAGEPE